MFSFFTSEKKKMRQHARNWLEVADRVFKFRRDQLTGIQVTDLQEAVGQVHGRMKKEAEVGQLKSAIERLELVLRDVGGRAYPVSTMVENVEFFLVAAIVILGLRAYFVQPFKIPTNSMWPSYYGMTASEPYHAGTEPGVLRKAVRLATLGASNYSVTAPADGEVMVGVFPSGMAAYAEKPGRSMLVFPATMHEYVFLVGGEPARIKVPMDFDIEYTRVVEKAFFKSHGTSIENVVHDAITSHRPIEQSTIVVREGVNPLEARVIWVPTGVKVNRGDNLLSFDILTGDLLFVDRFTYNFFPPQVGSGFVFKTEHIRNQNMQDIAGHPIEQYYIKRLVGTPGDTLEVKPPVLWRNGKPIEGAAAFDKNAHQEGLYPGYTLASDRRYGIEVLSEPGETFTVPAHSYFAMGDNSPLSKDSRYWGIVPDKDVVGRPLFIYYPLTSRWGPAR